MESIKYQRNSIPLLQKVRKRYHVHIGGTGKYNSDKFNDIKLCILSYRRLFKIIIK